MSDSCNNTVISDQQFTVLGPSKLYSTLGPTVIILYAAIGLLVIFLWLYALYYIHVTTNKSIPQVSYLQLSPALHVTLTIPVLLSPPVAPLVSLLQDIVAVSSMLVFTSLTTTLLGGVENIARLATTTHPTDCPIGTPPLCCLIPCRKPKITARIVHLILLPVKILSVVIIVNFLINIFLIYSGFYPDRQLLSLRNIHNFLIIPFFISCMYSYKVFISVSSNMLTGINHRLRGILMFIMFVFCKTSFGIINFLSDQNILPCLPGLSAFWLGMLLVTMIQVVGVSTIALVIPRLYSRDWDVILARITNAEESDVVEETKLVATA